MTEGMSTAGVDAYLRCLGVEQPAWPTLDALREPRTPHPVRVTVYRALVSSTASSTACHGYSSGRP